MHAMGEDFPALSSDVNAHLSCTLLVVDSQVLIGHRVGMVEAMAYDWTSKVLFWTTSSYKSVVAFRVPDKSRRDVVTGLRNPKGIAVHPTAG